MAWPSQRRRRTRRAPPPQRRSPLRVGSSHRHLTPLVRSPPLPALARRVVVLERTIVAASAAPASHSTSDRCPRWPPPVTSACAAPCS
jgi:hypothetical protein